MPVVWSAKAAHDLQRIRDRRLVERIMKSVDRLAKTGHGDVKRLQGEDNEFRLRVGGWRVRFTIADETLQVLRVLPRGGAY